MEREFTTKAKGYKVERNGYKQRKRAHHRHTGYTEKNKIYNFEI
jgi:hypothetical protein